MSLTQTTYRNRSHYRYSRMQRALHWIMAVVIVLALAIGLYCAYLDHTPEREFLMTIHKSLGMTALALLVLRIPVRAYRGEPYWQKEPHRHVRIAARVGHGLLYALMLLMPVAGYITSGAEGRDIPWFGLFNWPNLMDHDRNFGRLVGTIHEYGAYLFFIVLGLHLAAVVWHRLVKKDETLSRMV